MHNADWLMLAAILSGTVGIVGLWVSAFCLGRASAFRQVLREFERSDT